jgi:hypothetical protein
MGQTVITVLNILNQIRDAVSAALSGWRHWTLASWVDILACQKGDTFVIVRTTRVFEIPLIDLHP